LVQGSCLGGGIRTTLSAADSQLIEARQNLEFSLMASLAQK
jgi:hypothetical protein